jgi:hypothetical protein
MSKQSLPDAPAEVKPEPPHPILAMLRTIEESCRERDAVAACRLVTPARILEEREQSWHAEASSGGATSRSKWATPRCRPRRIATAACYRTLTPRRRRNCSETKARE